MAIAASYDSISQDLTVLGDTAANTITVSRNVAGNLLVNGGAVPITGGTATIANTDLIAVSGDLGSDTIALDETNGALPVAQLAGGGGNDSLTGGSGGDLIQGEDGDDTLLGRGGVDMIYGGADNDTLVGGDANDQLYGGLGNDRFVWNPGDDSDLLEGEDGSDTAEVNGGNGAETFTITANGTRVRFDRVDPAPFTLDIGTTESLVLNANGGNDTISTSGNLAALIALAIDGGAGNDTILGGNGADQLLGGDGDDFIDGNQGNDVAFMGAGADTFQWDPGDGSDTVEGQADGDTLRFNASAANEIIGLSANGGRILLTRNVGSIVMDVNDVETFVVNALGGTDAFTVNDLTGTDATSVVFDLAGTLGGSTGDSAVDTLNVNGTAVGDTIDINGSGTGYTISGLSATIAVANSEGANDSVAVSTLGGNDTIVATTLAAGVVQLTIDGGAGNDTIFGSQGADIIVAGDDNDTVLGDGGNDTVFLGTGDDVFQWSPGDGSDIIEGQADTDELQFVGSNASETIGVSANGSRVLFTRNVAAIVMDLNSVEKLRFDALGGADNIVVGDLSGTGTASVELRLAASGGGGDGAADTVSVDSTAGDDAVTISSSAGVVSVGGLAWTVSILDAEAANDRLTLNGLGGGDTINASALAAGVIGLTVNAGLGNDLVVGSAGDDLVFGGDGNDTAFLGGGNDTFVWNPGDDNDTVEGQTGTDTLTFNGANVAESIWIAPNGGRTLFSRDVASVTTDLNDVEVIQFAALGGADTITVGVLSSTDVNQVSLDLASTIGGGTGDAQSDTLYLDASTDANTIDVSGATGALLTVTGLPATVSISQFEIGTDLLTVYGLDGNDTISALGLVTKITALTIDAGAGNDTIRSNGDGTYRAGVGDDMVYAGLTNSSEILDGGDGTDTLDTTSWGGPYTIDMVTGLTNYSGENFTNFENLVSGAGDDTITGTTANNVISTQGGTDTIDGGAGNDTLDGGIGNDTLIGGTGDDWFYVDSPADVVAENAGEGTDRVLASVSYVLGAGVEVELLSTTNDAGTGAIDLTGNNLANSISGNAGNNVLDGGGGADAMAGWLGNDTFYVDDAGDQVVELSGQGTDTVISTVTYALTGTYAENLTLAGSSDINAAGNTLANVLTGNSGNNILNGAGGADTMAGGLGDDTYYVDNAADVVAEASGQGTDLIVASVSYALTGIYVENLTLTGSANLGATGNTLANIIVGNSGNNIINGGAAADRMGGGLGDDTYYVDNAGDVVVEYSGQGTDTVVSSVTYALTGVYAENLTLTGAANINATGNTLVNVLIGNTGNNILDGGMGADTLRGGLGNDTYYVDNAGDTVVEAPGEGTDTVMASVTYALTGVYAENLTLTGSANINATGNTLVNVLRGNSGNNILNGWVGADTMFGGLGDDTFYVDNAGDVAIEVIGEGTDTVVSSVTYALASTYVEKLTLTGAGNLNATGNSLANTLTGNTGNNVLDGLTGADTMAGGIGDDTYYVDNAGDVVTELSGQGTDTILSSVSYALTGIYVENLTLTGAANLSATGNTLANVLTGNSGNNILNGGGGADTMAGGLGDDTYYVDNAGDVVTELAGQGTDTVVSSVSYALTGVYAERLTLIGSANIGGTGNSLDNILIGNTGNNILNAAAGADSLNGGLGNDTLYGSLGADKFYFDTALGAGNVDSLPDFNVTDDTIYLKQALFAAAGPAGTLAAAGFYTGAAAHDADDRIIYNSATGDIFYDADGNAAGAPVLFAHVSAGLGLTNADFEIFA
jgi:Ca2+-binding RTX toxin-like protein